MTDLLPTRIPSFAPNYTIMPTVYTGFNLCRGHKFPLVLRDTSGEVGDHLASINPADDGWIGQLARNLAFISKVEKRRIVASIAWVESTTRFGACMIVEYSKI